MDFDDTGSWTSTTSRSQERGIASSLMWQSLILASLFWAPTAIGAGQSQVSPQPTNTASATSKGGTTTKEPKKHIPAGYRKKLDSLVRPFLDAEDIVGVVVGVAVGSEQLVVGYGRFAQDEQKAPDGNTLYEIGSISKTFTSLLLADMVERKLVRLDEPVQNLLPKSVQVPKRGKHPITLLDLATHTSGLPRMPSNWKPARGSDPYTDYTEEMLYQYLTDTANPGLLRSLASAVISTPAEPKYAYSNLGAGLLGHALAVRAGKSYEELLAERITRPLGMADTCIAIDAQKRRRFAPGYSADGVPVASWHWERSSLAGAGGIRSSVVDMLRYLSANMGVTKTSLRSAMDMAHQPRHKISEKLSIGLGWHINTVEKLVWHNGRTGGYGAMMLFDKSRQMGVVALANTSADPVDKLGGLAMRALRGQPLPPFKPRRSIKVSEDILKQYVGTYLALAVLRFTVTLEDGRLMVQLTGQEKIRVYPESETEFFYKVVNARITFEKDPEGRVTRLILHQHGRDIPAVKLPSIKQASSDPSDQPATP